ncbi:methylated-DNA--[protein]-cysteine S-methyltransferase [Nitrosophilus alvini]|uniref:methylated-DNA--[protein]-cysteine S-methyltransferase n=1 Tax=Nitrosophilus alvini TaxID=2714855 RepID=UPI001909F2AD|nr:methylated-DNA--[protein]-cysteine S-methyltransferase [Nitrosophilus alvini]
MHVFKDYFKCFIGCLEIVADNKEILRIDLVTKPGNVNANYVTGLAKEWFELYFAGKEPGFLPPLANRKTDFSRIVTEEVLKISFSKCKSYGEIAQNIGKPRAYRAVAQVMKSNPFMIIVPCHRVVSKYGIGGYNGGIHIKKKLLEFEKCASINL